MKKILLFLFICCFTNHVVPQTVNEAENFNLSTTESGDVIYRAKEYVKLLPGFQYNSSTIQSFKSQIDPTLVLPPSTGITGGPGGDIGSTGIVGALEGEFNVTPTGAATYEIPIYMPPGTSGMVPELSLGYNSLGGNGLLGPKWGISGLSEIVEVPQNAYYDDKFSNYLLDGMRLTMEYNGYMHTESESFQKIIQLTNYTGFEVQTKSGLKKYYGTSDDSRVKNSYSTIPFKFLLKKIEDNLGNYIEYEYLYNHITGEAYPQYIKYTGNASKSLLPYNQIEFVYEDRIDTLVNRANRAFDNTTNSVSYVTKQLVEIKCWNSGKLIKRYEINYTERGFSNTKYLSSIQEFGLNDVHYNKTIFDWNDIPIEGYPSNILKTFSKKGDIYPGDFNGDGKIEFLHTNEDGYYGHFYYNIETNSFSNPNYTFPKFENKPSVIVGDFNGDGRDDALFQHYEVSGNLVNESFKLRLGKTNSETLEGELGAGLYTMKSVYLNDPEKYNVAIPGDYNGDGILDIMLRSLNTGGTYIYWGNKTNPLSTYESAQTINIGSIHEDFDHYTGDFNGDGKTDIILQGKDSKKGENYFWYSQNDQNNYIQTSLTNVIKWNDKIIIADANSDGRSDIYCLQNNETLKIFQSSGNSFIETASITSSVNNFYPEPVYWDDYIEWGYRDAFVELRDLNNDGYLDITKHLTVEVVHVRMDYGNETRSYHDDYYYETIWGNPSGTSFTSSGLSESSSEYDDYLVKNYVDVNLDGYPDQIISNPYQTTHTFNFTNAKPNLVNKITNGLGQDIKINYEILGNNKVYNTENLKDAYWFLDYSYPISHFRSQIPLVYTIEINNGLNSYNTKKYEYGFAKMHANGKGFLGFKKVRVHDLQKNTTTTDTYKIIEPFYISVLSQRDFAYTTTSDESQRTSYTNEVRSWENTYFYSYPETIFTRVKKSYYADFYLYTNIEQIFDDYGNLTSSKTQKFYDNDSSDSYYIANCEVFTELATNQYDNFTENGKWILGRLTNASVTKSATGKPDITHTSAFEYFGAGSLWEGMLKKEIIEPGHPNQVAKIYEYDDFGNITKTTQQTAGMNDRILTSVYDHNQTDNGKYRYLTKTLNQLGHFEEKVYDNDYGSLIEHIDINGLITTNTYDEFGSLVKSIGPDGNKTETAVRWVDGDSDAPSNAVYYIWAKSSGSPESKVFFDLVGRKLREVNIGFDGQKIYSDIIYDSHGRVFKTSNPYFTGDTPVYATKLYDFASRPIKTTYPNGLEVIISYDGLSSSTTNNGKTKTLEVNADGKVIRSTDDNGTSVLFEYYSDGSLQKSYIENKPETEISKTYDIFKNCISITDPHKGNFTYEYNGFGELTMQVNEGDTVKLEYDILGRKIKRIEKEGETTWIYDTQTNGLGQIHQINGYAASQEFEYDQYGRPIKSIEVIDGEQFISENTYDNLGRADKLIYPTGFTIQYKYNQYGYMNKVVRNSDAKVLWEAEQVNAKGQLEQLTLGNGLQTTNTFDANAGFITGIQTDSTQNLTFNWSDDGNLLSRSDLTKSLTEEFSYDNLNRLTSTHVIGLDTVNLSYDALGNITYKSDVGDYGYGENGAGPNALTSILNNVGVKDIEQYIKYTSFNKVSEIVQGTDTLSLTYGIGHERKKQTIYTITGFKSAKYYVGGLFEKDTDVNRTKNIHYIKAGGGLFAIYNTYDDGFIETHYVHKDHLGSIQSISDENGSLVEEYSYDAWGKRRNAQTWEAVQDMLSVLYDRGFTGHEHLDLFELVNMNGRIYDPVVGRFLSADPFIQDVYNTQSHNRYSYCLNNPLAATDPSGYFFKQLFSIVSIIVPAIIAAITPVGIIGLMAISAATAAANVLIQGGNIGQAIFAITTSIVSAGFSFGVGDIFQGVAGWCNEIGRALTHGVLQGGIAIVQGGKFTHGFFSAGISSIVGSIMDPLYASKNAGNIALTTTVAGAVGGTVSVIGGGKFANGAITGAFVNLFNHMQDHEDQQQKQEEEKKQHPWVAARLREIASDYEPIETNNAGVSEHFIGPVLIALGQPIRTLKPVGALGSKVGSSIASKYLSKALPQKMGVRILGTKVLGRALGRFVPYVGWGLTIYDLNNLLGDIFPAYKEFHEDFKRAQKQPGSGPAYMGSDGIFVCFEKGTKVYTENGLVNIEKLKEGIVVYSYNLKKGELELKPIVKFFKREVTEVYNISVEKEVITVTSEHPFYVIDKGWVKVRNLNKEDLLLTSKGKTKKITTITRKNQTILVYNIEVADNHNYFVGKKKVLVHNK